MEERISPHVNKPAYYSLTIRAEHRQAPNQIIFSNSERALVIAALQDYLQYPTTPLPPRHHPPSYYIDLLGFSVTRLHITLIIFCVSHAAAQGFGAYVANRLYEFQQNEHPVRPRLAIPRTHIIRLPGPQMALHATLRLHASHTDWEYDRYSSIGFYLHDRRGDWMRLWRMSSLYGCDPGKYREILLAYMNHQKEVMPST